VTESAKIDPLPERSGFLALSGRKIYGDTKIDIYESELDI
jgi:hypothetical protein